MKCPVSNAKILMFQVFENNAPPKLNPKFN